MSKYYTPTIEEFHVGFEFECMPNTISKWKEYIFKPHDEPNYYIERGQVRVKYLDREDIEGYFDVKVFNEASIYGTRNGGEIKYEIESFGLPKHHMYKIWWQADLGDITFFTGEIKNKSELKRLLKQLKIIE
jgi:hypothetical protein